MKLTLILCWCKFQIGVLNSVTLQILMIVTHAVKIPLTLDGFLNTYASIQGTLTLCLQQGIVSITIITFT